MKFEIPNDPNDVPFSLRFRWWRERLYGRILISIGYKSMHFEREREIDQKEIVTGNIYSLTHYKGLTGSDNKMIITDSKHEETLNCITDKTAVPDCVSITNDYLNSILDHVLLNESKSKLVAIYARYNKENDCCEYGFKLENDICIPVFSGFDGGLYSDIACVRRASYIDLLKAILRSGPRVCWNVPFENSFSYDWFNYEKDKCQDKS